MATVKYTGARYVTKFADPIEWQANTAYEQIVACTYQGNTYISKQPVPRGVGNPADNPNFWLHWADPNAQMEELRQIVETYDGRIDETLETALNETKKPFNVLVVIGDSWSDESNDPDNTWLNQVSTKLGFKDYITNAKAGNGFARGGNNSIPNQCTGALNKVIAKGYTAEDVSHVIAIGGVNDYRRGFTYEDTADGIVDTYQNARSTFPNAKVIVIGPNAGKWDVMDTLDSGDSNKRTSYADFPKWATEICNRVNNNGFPQPYYCADWLNWYGSDAVRVYNEDTLHPNQTGANIIAAHIEAIILGRPIKLRKHENFNITITVDSIERTMEFVLTIENGVMNVAIRYPASNAIVGETTRTWTIPGSRYPLVPGKNELPFKAVGFTVCNYSPGGVSTGLTPYKGAFFLTNGSVSLYPANTGVINDIFASFSVPLY